MYIDLYCCISCFVFDSSVLHTSSSCFQVQDVFLLLLQVEGTGFLSTSFLLDNVDVDVRCFWKFCWRSRKTNASRSFTFVDVMLQFLISICFIFEYNRWKEPSILDRSRIIIFSHHFATRSRSTGCWDMQSFLDWHISVVVSVMFSRVFQFFDATKVFLRIWYHKKLQRTKM